MGNGTEKRLIRRCNMSFKKLLPLCFSVSFACLTIILTYSNVLAQHAGAWGWHGGPEMMGRGFGGIVFLFVLIFWLLLIAGLVLLIRLLLQKTSKKMESAANNSKALSILNERYARGEIEKKEFEEKKKDITS
jgi:putative membrane protein